MLLIGYLGIVLAFVILAAGLAGFSLPWQLRMRLTQEQGKEKKARPLFLISFLFPLSRFLLLKLKLNSLIKRKLDAAHIKMHPEEFLALKLSLMLLGGLCVFLLLKGLPLTPTVVALVMAYAGPDIWLLKRISGRKVKIAKLLPETVDLLGLCVEAGLDFTTAVKWIITKNVTNPALEELTFVLEEIKWGKSRSQALKDMAERLNIPEVSSFVQILVQAERMGTPVGDTFSILSDDMRMRRFHQGERLAMKAPIKILVPLIFCILPVIGIVVGGPVFLQFMQGDIFKGFGG